MEEVTSETGEARVKEGADMGNTYRRMGMRSGRVSRERDTRLR